MWTYSKKVCLQVYLCNPQVTCILIYVNIVEFQFSSPVPGPVTGVTFTKVSDSKIIVTWREPEMTNGLILHYIISYSNGQTSRVVSAGEQLSYMITGLGEI